jgi:hypothetical protein
MHERKSANVEFRGHRTLHYENKENRFTNLILEGEESARGKSEIPAAVILSNVSNLYDHFSRRQPTSGSCCFAISCLPTMTSWMNSNQYGNCSLVTDYKKINRIGEGTYGYVYRAVNKQTKEVVALKRIILNHAEQEGFP